MSPLPSFSNSNIEVPDTAPEPYSLLISLTCINDCLKLGLLQYNLLCNFLKKNILKINLVFARAWGWGATTT